LSLNVDVSVDEELKAAKTAKAVIDQLSTTTAPKLALWRTLRTAKDAAVLNLGSDGGRALNDARAKELSPNFGDGKDQAAAI
jgi:hypothetical protein